jgi:phosphoribosylaminoimidazolecarboxamide formyltransferase / IMP cyclohydrolase
VIVAPSFSDEALAIMKKKENIRVLLPPKKVVSEEIRAIDGGILVQKKPPLPGELESNYRPGSNC